MPTDLDDMFASVARQADGIPLGTAAQARGRGRRRTRNGLIASAAAVCVVLAGVGVLARPDRLVDRKTVAPGPSPTASIGAMPQVGAPIAFGVKDHGTVPVLAAGRAFTAWRAGDGSISVVAADLRTGAVDWKLTGLGDPGSDVATFGLSAVDQGVMIAVDDRIYVNDPAGADANDWLLTVADLDEVVPFEKALVRRWSINGQVDAHDWRTGRKLWSLDPGADGDPDKVVRVAGAPSGGDRVVLVTQTGKLQVRDSGTGTLLRTITPASPAVEGSNYIADGEWLFEVGAGCCDTEGYRVVATNLETGGSRVILTEGVGHSPAGSTVCGPGRVCVLDQQDNALFTVTAVDVAQGRQVWSVPGPSGGSISAMGSRVLVAGDQTAVLFDDKGQQTLRRRDARAAWLDGERLLTLPTLGSGEVMVVNVADNKVTGLGRVAHDNDQCAHTADRLVCAGPSDLRIYRINE